MENSLYKDSEKYPYISVIEKVKNDLPLLVKESRLNHIMSVVKTAGLIADFFVSCEFMLEKDEVTLGALLHDITKCMNQKELCEKFAIQLKRDDILSEETLHALTGAYYAKKHYEIPENVFYAIARHTLGGENMTLTEKIIFVSDYCEETRTHSECQKSRESVLKMINETGSLSKKEILRAFDFITAEILGKTIKYLSEKSCHIHQTTIASFNFLVSQYSDDSGFMILKEKYSI